MLPLLLFLSLSAGLHARPDRLHQGYGEAAEALRAKAEGGAYVQRPADVVKWSAIAPASTVSSGATVKVSLTADVAEGWKLYAITQPKGGPQPLDIAVAGGAPVTFSKKQIVAPKPKTLTDENFDLETLYYDSQVVFSVPVTLSGSVSGVTKIPFEITYQACGNGICLRPFTEKVNVLVSVK